jgi:hypothetical protein
VDTADILVSLDSVRAKFGPSPTVAETFVANAVIMASAEFFQGHSNITCVLSGRQAFRLPLWKLTENGIGKNQAAAWPNSPVRVVMEKVETDKSIASRHSVKLQFCGISPPTPEPGGIAGDESASVGETDIETGVPENAVTPLVAPSSQTTKVGSVVFVVRTVASFLVTHCERPRSLCKLDGSCAISRHTGEPMT